MTNELTAIRAHPDVVSQRLDDEVVLVNLQTNRIFALNPTAARYWELLVDGHSQEEIVDVMTAEFDVSAEHLRGEIASLVAALSDEHLVHAAAGDP